MHYLKNIRPFWSWKTELKNSKSIFGLSVLCLLAPVSIAHAQVVDTNPATQEQLSPTQRMLGDNDQSSNAEKTEATSTETTSETNEPVADLAFGAFQRGRYLTAFQLALPRANAGDPAAQTLIAELYEKGLGVPRDVREATAWYGIAAKNGNIEAQFAYAVKLLEGKHVKPNPEEARVMMKNAADAGHASAAFNFGQLILKERPTSQGVREALGYFESSAKAGTKDAYYMLSQLHASGKINGYPDYEEAQEWLFKAANAGIDSAQVELAIWLMQGKAGIQDDRVAYLWMKRAAMGGNVIGQNRLAKMLINAIGTPKDVVEGIKWYIIARRAGLTDINLEARMNALDKDDLAKALEAANRWPSG